jgi:ribose 5-phosphate isomerase A
MDELKQAAANSAAAQLHDGMVVGLGSGSTARLAVGAIGLRVKEGLQIIGIPTSEQTAEQARSLGIPLSTLGEYSYIDVTIDGADEVELGHAQSHQGWRRKPAPREDCGSRQFAARYCRR